MVCHHFKTTFFCRIDAWTLTQGEANKWTRMAATPTSGRRLAEQLEAVVKGKGSSKLAQLAFGEHPLRSLKAELAGPCAEVFQAWWRDLSGEEIFRKVYDSDPGNTKVAHDRHGSLMITLRHDKGEIGNNTGTEDQTEAGDAEEGAHFGAVRKLNFQILGLREHEYEMLGAIHSQVKPGCGSVKIGLTGEVISATGGTTRHLKRPTHVDHEAYSVLSRILNDSNKSTTSHQEGITLPPGALPAATLDALSQSLIGLATERPVAKEPETEGERTADKDSPRTTYTLDLSFYPIVSPSDGTLYSQHALSPDDNPSAPRLWYPSSGKVKYRNQTMTLEFSGCLLSFSPTTGAPRADEMPNESLLSEGALQGVQDMNFRLEKYDESVSKSARAWATSKKNKIFLKEALLSSIGAHIFREALPEQLRPIDSSSLMIKARPELKIAFNVPTTLEVRMTPEWRVPASSSS